jgi:S-(hydroxymethyl)glutathione dehydrogenase/alcohol dehydrogenase
VIPDVLGAADSAEPFVPGHGGVGIVEAVGSSVRRVEIGDRVIVTITPWCGECYNCMNGRPDRCLGIGASQGVCAEMDDGTPIRRCVGGHSELIVGDEEWMVPVFTSADAGQLSLLSCVSSCGLGMVMTRLPVEAGSDVVVFGAGPVGLSAVQGARIRGASQIIVVEPIGYRRELALKLGATTALDPNAEGEQLVPKIRRLCTTSNRRWAGGGKIGPDYVFEAVGGDLIPPKERGPDPTGVSSLRQAWELGSTVGGVVTAGVGQPTGATISFPATQWANGRTTHLPGKGTNLKRDLPRYVRFIEAKQFDAKSLVTATYPLDRAREAYQAVGERTVVSAVITFG